MFVKPRDWTFPCVSIPVLPSGKTISHKPWKLLILILIITKYLIPT